MVGTASPVSVDDAPLYVPLPPSPAPPVGLWAAPRVVGLPEGLQLAIARLPSTAAGRGPRAPPPVLAPRCKVPPLASPPQPPTQSPKIPPVPTSPLTGAPVFLPEVAERDCPSTVPTCLRSAAGDPQRVAWRVSAKTLRSKCQKAVSSTFYVSLPPHEGGSATPPMLDCSSGGNPRWPFQIVLYSVPRDDRSLRRGDAGLNKAQQFRLELKCLAELDAPLEMTFAASMTFLEGETPSFGSQKAHDFAEKSTCGMGSWNIPVDEAGTARSSWGVTVHLEVLAVAAGR